MSRLCDIYIKAFSLQMIILDWKSYVSCGNVWFEHVNWYITYGTYFGLRMILNEWKFLFWMTWDVLNYQSDYMN